MNCKAVSMFVFLFPQPIPRPLSRTYFVHQTSVDKPFQNFGYRIGLISYPLAGDPPPRYAFERIHCVWTLSEVAHQHVCQVKVSAPTLFAFVRVIQWNPMPPGLGAIATPKHSASMKTDK